VYIESKERRVYLERTTGRMHQSLSWATAAGCGGLFALLACRGRGCEYARVGIAVVDLAGVLGAVPPAMINGSIEPTGTTSLVLPGRVCTANMAAGAGTTGGALTVVYVENRVVTGKVYTVSISPYSSEKLLTSYP
jgi:hypothetical protein